MSFSLGVPTEIIGAAVLACGLLTAALLLVIRIGRKRDAILMRERYLRERMQELCPDGWSARILLYGDGAPVPGDVPGERNVRVDWAEYTTGPAGHTDLAVTRRIWARTIPDALREMIADRELDLELEKIERKVIEELSEGRGGRATAG